jgi:hypothetical protein
MKITKWSLRWSVQCKETWSVCHVWDVLWMSVIRNSWNIPIVNINSNFGTLCTFCESLATSCLHVTPSNVQFVWYGIVLICKHLIQETGTLQPRSVIFTHTSNNLPYALHWLLCLPALGVCIYRLYICIICLYCTGKWPLTVSLLNGRDSLKYISVLSVNWNQLVQICIRNQRKRLVYNLPIL